VLKHKALCRIIQVYDREVIEEQDVPVQVQKKLEFAPGLIFALVETIPHGRRLYLPLKENEEYIYQVYGNAPQINGRLGEIEYESLSIENGRVVIQRTWMQPILNVRQVTEIADIGRII